MSKQVFKIHKEYLFIADTQVYLDFNCTQLYEFIYHTHLQFSLIFSSGIRVQTTIWINNN